MARLEIEHIIPLAQGGTDEESNLWLGHAQYAMATRATRLALLILTPEQSCPLFNPQTELVVGTLCMG